ncbi:MAG TPA: NAD(P)-dependent alcohol dehydrogenase [Anaerolineae bacterium]|nr:NAD(P)-dependent alcohol dehydrogenase [Anaerolineae bacterium]HQI84426.1 NAD(P)-dependent alcohol dehydrogenase [Anaerolineae bacterium]
MKAIVYIQFGPPEVLQFKDVEKPAPKENEVLIRIHATSVNFGDLMARNFKAVSPRKFNMPFIIWLPAKISFGLQRPKLSIPGSEFAGEIEAVGKAVTRFKTGDPVFGFSSGRFGAYAEYLCLPENGMLAIKPANLTYEEAAVVPYGAITALNLLKKVNIQPGQKVLIHGASGGIGSAAVQIARHLGAEVTGVCGTPRLEFVKSLGASQVIDYTKEDFTQNGETYDLILDILGKGSFSRMKNSLKPNGIVLYASFKMKQLVQMLWTSRAGGRKVICALAPGSAADLMTVKALIEAGQIKAVIDQSFPLEHIAEAHRYVEQGHKKGNVVITVGNTHENQGDQK